MVVTTPFSPRSPGLISYLCFSLSVFVRILTFAHRHPLARDHKRGAFLPCLTAVPLLNSRGLLAVLVDATTCVGHLLRLLFLRLQSSLPSPGA